MSFFKMLGDALGSGTFTIKSPNSNNNRLLELPNASGIICVINKLTAVTLSGQTFVDFVIPPGVDEILVPVNALSTNGTDQVQLQLGTGGVPTVTGYSGATDAQTNGSGIATAASTGLVFERSGVIAAANARQGLAILTRLDGNEWNMSYKGVASVGSIFVMWGAASVTLAGEADLLRLTTVSGAALLDAGKVGVICKSY